jgi:hypothetical protein
LGGKEGADGAEREKFHEEEYRIQNIEYRRLLAEMECHCDFRVPGGDWGFGKNARKKMKRREIIFVGWL